jgi:prolyl oligopeptidase
MADDDPFLGLEDITGDAALDWVREHNDPTLAELSGDRFDQMRAEALAVLDTDARIPYVRRRGEHLYNFWRDAEHPRGLWRRTSLEQYRSEQPDWDVVIDVDALAAADDENWVWGGADVIEPEYTRALVSLSRGGSDAAVVREFDMQTRQFVRDGFTLPEAKTQIGWEDEDTVLVGTDFGPGSLTDSGYPRLVKRWRRGRPLGEAEVLFSGSQTDVIVAASVDRTPGFERTFVRRAIDFFNDEVYELRGGELIRIDAPTDATVSVHREWLLIELRTDWYNGADVYRAGSLLAADYDEFLAGTAELHVVFEPDAHTGLNHYAWTRDRLMIVTLADVASRVEVVKPGSWYREQVTDVPETTNTVSTGRHGCCTARQVARCDRSNPRRRSSMPTISLLPSTSRRRMTAPRSRTSLSLTGTRRGPERRCSAATVASRWRERRAMTGCWAGCGWLAAARTCSPTSAAAVSTGPAGTPRRCGRAGTWWQRISWRSQGIW